MKKFKFSTEGRIAFASLSVSGALIVIGSVAGCSHGTLDASLAKIQTAPILDRHDAYVNSDESLSPGEKAKYLKTSANWRASLEKALAPDEPVK